LSSLDFIIDLQAEQIIRNVGQLIKPHPMRVVVQRVSRASVTISGRISGSIGEGLMVLLGIEGNDDITDIEWLASKIVSMRIFSDVEGKMNKDIREFGGDILLVSQFTLHASTKKGNRPSFIRAARPEQAIPLYQTFIQSIEQTLGKAIQTGEFGAMMEVELVNNGPVTIVMDSKQKE
jgi:D-aminoacyl-tRNA deacylase